MTYRGICTCRVAIHAIAFLAISLGPARAELIVALESLQPQLILDDQLTTVLDLFETSYFDAGASALSQMACAHTNSCPIEFPSNEDSLGASKDGCDDGTSPNSSIRSSSTNAILCRLLHLKKPLLVERISEIEKWIAPNAPTFESLRPS